VLLFELFPAFMLVVSAIIGIALFLRNRSDSSED
jgi:hypothetical protein